VTVDYATSDGTANTVENDYTSTSGTLVFSPGQTSQTFDVPILDDSLDEPDETVRLTLSNQTVATLGSPSSATLTIEDNDTNPTCPGLYPTGEPNLGAPNGGFARIACDVGMIIDLGSTPLTTGHTGYDLVYYETQGNPLPSPPEQIFMDWVTIEVGPGPNGPWQQVFYWGDSNPDLNTTLGQAGYVPPENDNILIPMTIPPLYGTVPYTTGIAIDLDSLGLTGTYQYVRIYSPLGGGDDGPEIDAIEVLP
jgi:hypothetical protein